MYTEGVFHSEISKPTEAKRIKPKKANYRQRAHCNPLSDSFIVYPPAPSFVDWSLHFPASFGKKETNTLYLNTVEFPVNYDSRQSDYVNGLAGPRVEFVDVGCGFGGLLFSLAPLFPTTLIFGMEIREKVATYVGKKIHASQFEYTEGTCEELLPGMSCCSPLTSQSGCSNLVDSKKGESFTDSINSDSYHEIVDDTSPASLCSAPPISSDVNLSMNVTDDPPASPHTVSTTETSNSCSPSTLPLDENLTTTRHSFTNISVIRSNAMKFFVNYFRKYQLSKIFFCFPDPQFKKANIRRRIISPSLLSSYAFTLRPGGMIYTVTDVPELHKWMRACFLNHPSFREASGTELTDDVCLKAIKCTTEEGKKVIRSDKPCYASVFIRLPPSV